MTEIKNRSELVFLYDVKDANPNGDPLDSNKPRIDEETGINIVTDVRLKRTVRDHIFNLIENHEEKSSNSQATNKVREKITSLVKGQDIFVREKPSDNEGHIQDAKLRAKDFIELTGKEEPEEKEIIERFKKGERIEKTQVEIIKNNISTNLKNKAVDIRLFGATVPLEFDSSEINGLDKNKSITSSITLTGPVQFRIGRSLHRVDVKHIKGTGAFASKPTATQKTFREEDVVSYSLINFYGIINENAAKHTKLTENDVTLLIDGIWNGTKNLISRSKAGQLPRLLLKVEYKEKNYHIGDLDKLIKIKSKKRDEEIRDISDVELDISELISALNTNKDKIKSISKLVDYRTKIDFDGLDKSINLIDIILE
ncbi:MAG: type I-B CRISPR-associated protein Cas7/Csh2 [Candidatus Altiarchaeia archaeon]